MSDSIISLPVANIFGNKIFLPEEAGMKTTRVDTVIMMDKITRDLSDLLAENTHVFIKDYGRGALATASFRGTAPSHTQVYWNGMNINSPMLGMVDFSLIPVYILDDVSLHHGTASIADGSGGLGGSINLQNTPQWGKNVDLRFLQGVGSFSTIEDFLSFSVGNDNFQSKSRAYWSYSKNDYTFLNKYKFDIDPETGDFVYPVDTNKNAEYQKLGFLQELYYRSGSGAVWSAKYWGQRSEREMPGVASYEGLEASRRNNLSEENHKIILNRTITKSGYSLALQSGLRYHYMNYYLKNYIPGYGYRNSVFSNSEEFSVLNKADFVLKLSNSLSVNASLSYNYYDVSTADTVSDAGYDTIRNDLSLYLSIRKQFFNVVNTNFMLRQGIVDGEVTPVTPFFGFDIMLNDARHIILKGNVAGNFHQPTLNDLYWLPGGNPDLLPEKGFSTELGAEALFQVSECQIIPDITIFYSDIDDWIIWTYSGKGYWNPMNIKRVVSKGMEASVDIKWECGNLKFVSIATYSFTQALNYGDPLVWGDQAYGKQLVYIPVHSGNLMFGVSWKKWSATWQHNSYSKRFTTSSNDLTRRASVYPYFMNDLKLGRDFSFRSIEMSAELKVNNLFDETYHSVLIQPMPGINVMFQLMIDLL